MDRTSQPISSQSTTCIPEIDHNPLIVTPETELREILELMSPVSSVTGAQVNLSDSSSKEWSSYVLVMADQQLLGIFTAQDIVQLSASDDDFANVKVTDVMIHPVITLQAWALQDSFTVLNLFQTHQIRYLPILDDSDHLVGVITSESLRRSLGASPFMKLRSVGDVMDTQMLTASPSASVAEITQLMATHHMGYVVIAQSSGAGANPIGIMTERDIVQCLRLGLNLRTLTAQSVMSTPLVCINARDALWDAHKMMDGLRLKHLIVADPQDGLTGILTQAHILSSLQNIAEMHFALETLQQQVSQLQEETHNLHQMLRAHAEDRGFGDTITLENYQERFRATFEQAAVGMAHVNLEGQFIIVNQCFCEWIGYSQAELLERSFIEITHPDDHDLDQEKIQQLLAGEVASFSREKRYQHKNGSILWGNVTVSLAINAFGDPDYFITVVEDIGDRKQATSTVQELNQTLESRIALNVSAFRASEQRHRLLFELAPDLLFMLNMRGEIRQVNTSVLERLGYSTAELLGRPLFQLIHIASEDIDQSTFNLQIKQEDYRQEMELQCQDGTRLFVDCSCSTITDTFEQDPYILVIQRDISDRIAAEAALKASEERYRSLYENTPVMLHSTNNNGELVSVSKTWLTQLGYELSEVIGRPSTDFLTPDSRHYAQTVVWPEYLQTGVCQDIPYQFVKNNGDIIDVLLSAIAERDTANKIVRTLAVSVDITQRKQIEAALLESEQRFRLAFNEAAIGMVLVAPDGHWLRVNQAICNILGYGESDLLGITFQDITHPDDIEIDLSYVQQMLTGEINTYQLEKRYLHQQGHVVWVLLSVSLVRDQNQPLYFISQIQDITQRKRAERDLFQEKELAQVTLDSIGDAVITTDVRGHITKFNPVAEHLTGWMTREAKGQALSEVFNIIHETTREPAEEPVQRALRQGRIVGLANHTVLISRDGTEYAIEDSAAPIRDRNGQVIGAVMVFHDVTHSRKLTHQLSWQASHDPLTRLANRRKFDQVLAETLQNTQQPDHEHVLCFLDLDQFKVINDTCGHAAGDELLCKVAKILQNPIRSADTLARLGGDEFGILLHQCPLDRALHIANSLRQSIQEYRFQWENQTFGIGVSIGLVQINRKNTSIEEVLGAADAACYAAKAKGRNRIQVYKANDSELIHQRGEQLWSVRIKQAIEDNRLCLYRQLIVPTSDTEPHTNSCEILLRMMDEEGEVVTAAEFIPAAERYSLISEIDRWVVRKFLSDYGNSFINLEQPGFQCSRYMINLSGVSIGDEQFLHFLKAQLEQQPDITQKLCFEITETAAISNLSEAAGFIQELKQLGCQFALDDFGSGMSSFAYLKTLPVDYLKIDGRFIEDMTDDPTTYAIVESINHIGHVMGMKTIAEFVSTVSIRDKLKEMGVDYVQGFEISKPQALL